MLEEPHLEAPLDLGRVGEQGFRRRGKALRDARGADDGQGRGALADVVGVQQEPDEAAEVVAMQVRDEDRRHPVGVEPELLHADERGRPAVEQECIVPQIDVKARLETAARSEGVPRADDGELHGRLAGRTAGDEAEAANVSNCICVRAGWGKESMGAGT